MVARGRHFQEAGSVRQAAPVEGATVILVVGATGLVGGDICRRLASRQVPLRALVRPGSDSDRGQGLEAPGIERVVGDLRDRASLDAACRGIEAVITTASAMPFSYIAGENDITSVDLEGTIQLIEAARAAGVRHFVYTSLSGGLDLESPLRNAKRAVEQALRGAGMTYTILRPACFMEVWLTPAVGFDYVNAKATVYGEGDRPVSYISAGNVAAFAVRTLSTLEAWNGALELGGPEPLAPLDVVHIFERVTGRPFVITYVSEDVLRGQQEAATDAMHQSLAGLARCVAQGDAIPMKGLLSAMPIALTSVAEYAERVIGNKQWVIGTKPLMASREG